MAGAGGGGEHALPVYGTVEATRPSLSAVRFHRFFRKRWLAMNARSRIVLVAAIALAAVVLLAVLASLDVSINVGDFDDKPHRGTARSVTQPRPEVNVDGARNPRQQNELGPFDVAGDPERAIAILRRHIDALQRASDDAPFHFRDDMLAELGQLQRKIGQLRISWAPPEDHDAIRAEDARGEMAEAEAAVRLGKRLDSDEKDGAPLRRGAERDGRKKDGDNDDEERDDGGGDGVVAAARVSLRGGVRPDRTLGRGNRYLPKTEVVVGIASARGHFEERQVLRDTWVGHLKSEALSARVVVKFVLGNKGCDLDPKDRADKYGCEPAVTSVPVVDKEVVAYRVPRGTVGAHKFSGPIGMDFETHHPVIITKIGVFDSGSDGLRRNITARLYSTDTRQLAVTVVFTPQDPGILVGGTRFKSLRPQIAVPRGFRGSIVAEGYGPGEPSNNMPTEHGTVDTGGGLISFLPVSRFGVVKNKFPDSEERLHHETNQYAAGNFVFKLNPEGKSAIEEIQKDIESRERRTEAHRQRLAEENARLAREQEEHGDLLLLDHLDTYRSLPTKMLLFHKWIYENIDAEFVLKIDDDCYLDFDAVLRGLEAHGLRKKRSIWWSRFRNDWLVERWGKWREPDYAAPVYPSFACGGGNLMSSDLSEWVARNADSLKTYQGEDTSMGIWLASLKPTLVKDYAWHVLEGCVPGMYSAPELTGDQIVGFWRNLTLCGNACDCSKGKRDVALAVEVPVVEPVRHHKPENGDGGDKGEAAQKKDPKGEAAQQKDPLHKPPPDPQPPNEAAGEKADGAPGAIGEGAGNQQDDARVQPPALAVVPPANVGQPRRRDRGERREGAVKPAPAAEGRAGEGVPAPIAAAGGPGFAGPARGRDGADGKERGAAGAVDAREGAHAQGEAHAGVGEDVTENDRVEEKPENDLFGAGAGA